ncbi:MAG: APC family permease [Planctomycetota bacterium]
MLDVTMLVMGSIVGAGIFFSPHKVAAQVEDATGVLLVWGAGGVVALLGGFVFAELGARYPRTGGQYVFLREALGPRVAFLYGWCLLAIVTAGTLVVVSGIAVFNLDLVIQSITGREGNVFSPIWQAVLAAVLLSLLTAINVRGVRLGAWVHNGVMLLKIAGLLLVVGCAIAVFVSGEPAAQDDASPVGDKASGSLVVAFLAALFSYGGWQNATAAAGEMKDAQRTLPKAMVLGVSLVVALYLAVNLSLLEILGLEGLQREPVPFAAAAGRVLGGVGGGLVAGMIFVSTLGITHAILLLTPRVYEAMAQDGVFFQACARRHERWGTPHVAIFVQLGFTLLQLAIALWWTLTQSEPGMVFLAVDPTLEALVFVDWIWYTLAGVCLFCFRRRAAADDAPTFRAPAYPFIPGAFTLGCFAIVVWAALDTEPKRLILPGAVIASGLIALWFAARRSR